MNNLKRHEKLKAYRESKEMNQADMARLIGVSRQYYHQIEKGELIPPIKILFNISKETAGVVKPYDWV